MHRPPGVVAVEPPVARGLVRVVSVDQQHRRTRLGRIAREAVQQHLAQTPRRLPPVGLVVAAADHRLAHDVFDRQDRRARTGVGEQPVAVEADIVREERRVPVAAGVLREGRAVQHEVADQVAVRGVHLVLLRGAAVEPLVGVVHPQPLGVGVRQERLDDVVPAADLLQVRLGPVVGRAVRPEPRVDRHHQLRGPRRPAASANSSGQSWAIMVSTGALNAHMLGTPKWRCPSNVSA